jgi:cobyric acid synthase
MFIIPGGSLVESQSVTDGIKKEILKMADAGKFVLGICSGFQILSRGTDIGRLSPTPIFKAGLGLLDVEFKPMICTDQVKATIIGASYLTSQVGAGVSGFHCHTYGNITLGKKSKPILKSQVKRLDYHKNPGEIVSGAANAEGNVVGILTHALLDHNPLIIQGIAQSLGICEAGLSEIRATNAKLQIELKAELGISTKIYPETQKKPQRKGWPRALIVTALESGGGKTVLVTGLAGALKKRGLNVGVVKVGGDIRDIVPALYLTKEPMQPYASIEVADTGWRPVAEVAAKANEDYDFVIVEGAMNAFTGILFDQTLRPNSTAEVAAALGAPVVVVAGCDKEGIEGGVVSALNCVRFMRKLGINMVGVVLNKVYLNYLSEDARVAVKQAFDRAGAEVLGLVPVSNLEGRGAIPEVEIKYEEFTTKVMELVEQSVDVDRVVEVAAPFAVKALDYEAFVAKFKAAL